MAITTIVALFLATAAAPQGYDPTVCGAKETQMEMNACADNDFRKDGRQGRLRSRAQGWRG